MKTTRVLLCHFSLFTLLTSHFVHADTRLITKLDVRDTAYECYNASHWIEQANIQPGAPLYGDNENLPATEQTTIATIPATLVGADWIQPSAFSRTFTTHTGSGDMLASFELREDAEVYIAHYDSISPKPAWLAASRYTPLTGDNATLTNTQGGTFKLYRRLATKGEKIALGPNGSSTAPMYLVLVKARTKSGSDVPPHGSSGTGVSPVDGSAASDNSANRNPHSAFPTIDITTLGARGDGHTNNTIIIQKAIDDLSARGGGTVLINGGIFIAGTLELKDNITLHIEAGSILRASANHADFPPKQVSLPGFRSDEPYQFIFANNRRNISITGGGIIDGYGLREGFPWGGRNNENARPRLIRMFSCQNVRVENITLIRSANWTQYYESCTDMVFHDVRVRCHTGVNNQDGIDLSGCRNVDLNGFYGITGDDTICIKALTLTPAENIRIANVFSPYANCNILKIGTETHGALKNLHATNVEGVSRYSIAIETVDGSDLENITYENMTLYDCGTPLFVRLAARGRTFEGGPKPATPGALRNVTLRNIRNYANTYGAEKRGVGIGSAFAGLPNLRIQNLLIEDCDLLFYGGQTDDKVITRDIPENPTSYPEYNTFGHNPAYGLYFRHIDGLTIRNTRLRVQNADIRPAIVLDDVTDTNITTLETQMLPQTQSVQSKGSILLPTK